MSVVSYARYTTATGRITGVGTCVLSDLPLQAQSGETTMVTDNVVNDAKNYVVDGVLTELQGFPEITKTVVNASGAYTITLANIPAGTSVTWSDGFISEENDGTLECVVAFPDEYRFLLEHVCHFPLEIIVNV